MSARVAVITRTRGRTLLLERAVRSVLAQTSPDFVHVVVNDGGDPDAVEALLERYADQYAGRLHVLHHPRSQGMEAASNAGIDAVASKYVTIHDDDDSWEPAFLEKMVHRLENSPYPSVKGVVCLTTQVFETIEADRVRERWRREFDPDLWTVSLPMISEINRFMPISFLFERGVLDDIGMYDAALPVIGDWEFNIRFLMRYDIEVLREPLANYHIRESATEERYHNTVTIDNGSHQFFRSLIINKHIRDDLRSGTISKGWLLAQGDYFYRTGRSVWRIVQVLERIKNMRLVRWLRRLMRA